MSAPSGAESLLWVLAAGAFAPWLSDRLASLRLPVVALELVFGVLIGPQGLGLAQIEGPLPYLARFGVTLLFFLAGMEIDFARLRGKPLALGTASWVLSLGLGGLVAFGFSALGLVREPEILALALSTTALGIIAPILRDAKLTDTPIGLLATACGVMGEIGPILLMSALFVSADQQMQQVGLTALYAAIVVGVCWASFRIRPPGVLALLGKSMHRSGQWPVRLCTLLLGLLVWIAESFHLDLALGAFAAGLAVGLANRNPHSEVLEHKLDAIGFGLLVPVFFITSGMQLDVQALIAQPHTLALVAVFAGLLLLVRGLPALIFMHWVGLRGATAVGLYAATSLSLIVALTSSAVESGRMQPLSATVLVSAGLVSVLLFPWLAGLLLGRNPSPGARADEDAL